MSRDHKTHTHRGVAIDFKQSTNHRENEGRVATEDQRLYRNKQEELSRDQTSTVITFITLEVTAR